MFGKEQASFEMFGNVANYNYTYHAVHVHQTLVQTDGLMKDSRHGVTAVLH